MNFFRYVFILSLYIKKINKKREGHFVFQKWPWSVEVGFLHPTMRVLLEIIPLLDQGASTTSAALVFYLAGSAFALEVHRQHASDDGIFPITFGYFLNG